VDKEGSSSLGADAGLRAVTQHQSGGIKLSSSVGKGVPGGGGGSGCAYAGVEVDVDGGAAGVVRHRGPSKRRTVLIDGDSRNDGGPDGTTSPAVVVSGTETT
jgi:hypothetical protein